jgi:4'-phosphopantetheinyl transferase
MARAEILFASLEADAAAVEEARTLLDTGERARADSYRFDRDRRRFVVRRATLRRLLAKRTGTAPEALAFEENAFGKPRLRSGPCFSTSHSGERMMVAIADVEIGCDLERIDPAVDWRPLAESFFAPGEQRALADREAFFRCWSRKEAFVKALGQGLSYPLDAFEVSVGPEPALIAGGHGWAIAAPDAGPGYAAALVARA